MIRSTVNWFDARLGTNRFVRSAVDKAFPDHWSFLLGEIAMYCFTILVLTGTYLAFFFDPSSKDVVYHGSYAPLRDVHMSQAYESTLRLSFDVRAGLVFRQIHHWAAIVFLGAIVVHLCRIFFTGAFRRPREINWIIGVTLLLLAMVNGFFGYSLPDDLLSGTGLRIMYSVALAVPLIGTWLAFLLFGGEFPASDITTRLYVLHILIVPALIAGLLGVHLAIVWRQKHTQFPGPGRREDNVVGSPLWPTYGAKSVSLFAAVFAVLCLLGGLAQINPVWLYGPFKPASVSTAAQPDWYMGWLEGALRLAPAWRPTIFGYPISELFWPAVLLPGLTFLLVYSWPFLEAKVTGDRATHHLLDRPRDRPVRTGLGVGTLVFFVVLFVAGSQDIVAQYTSSPIAGVNTVLRVLAFVLPAVAALASWRLCHQLQAGDRLEHEKDHVRRQLTGEASADSEPDTAPPRGRVRKIIGGVLVILLARLLRRRRHDA